MEDNKLPVTADSLLANEHTDQEITQYVADVLITWGLDTAKGNAYANAVISLFEAPGKVNRERLLQLIKFMVLDHPDKFGEELLREESFQAGILTVGRNYIALRQEEKRDIAKRILLGFVGNADRERFKLERLLTTLSSISVESLEYLGFIRDTIIPRWEAKAFEEAEKVTGQAGHDLAWWLSEQKRREVLSKYIQNWMDEKFNPNTPAVKARQEVSKPADIWEEYSLHQRKKNEALGELGSLGIFGLALESGGALGSGGASAEYQVTEFGLEFIGYLSD
jgi:hypothetical protein